MSIEVNCTKCGTKFYAPDGAAGKSGKCPKCQAPIPVPTAEEIADRRAQAAEAPAEPEKKEKTRRSMTRGNWVVVVALMLGILGIGGAVLGVLIFFAKVGPPQLSEAPRSIAENSQLSNGDVAPTDSPGGGQGGENQNPPSHADERPLEESAPESTPDPTKPVDTRADRSPPVIGADPGPAEVPTRPKELAPGVPPEIPEELDESPDLPEEVPDLPEESAPDIAPQPERVTQEGPDRSAFKKADDRPEYIKNGIYSFREAFVCLIAGDGEELQESIHWFAARKRPTVGQRWGLVLYVAGSGEQPTVTFDNLSQVGGSSLGRLQGDLAKRLTGGPNGYWPRPFGLGFAAELLPSQSFDKALTEAQSKKLDYLLCFEMAGQSIRGTERYEATQVKLYDVASKKVLWTSPRAKPGSPDMGPVPMDPDVFQPLLRKMDSELALGAMPELTSEQVTRRIGALLGSPRSTKDEVLPVLAEIRYYQVQGLLSDDHANVAYGRLLDADAAAAMAKPDEEQCRRELHRWLDSAE